jgi:ribosomal protein S18 acetylase RimI-like enzyme
VRGDGERATLVPRSLVWATSLDVLPVDCRVVRGIDYLAVRSPSNPTHYWGNYLLFDQPPRTGERGRWEALFDSEFAVEPEVRHRTFAWDRTDGAVGAAREEFVGHGYDLDESIGLVATPERLRQHRRANRAVTVRSLNPAVDADEHLWTAVVELQVQNRDPAHDEDDHRTFTKARLTDLRDHFRAGHGGWYVAIDPASDEVAASCGVVVKEGRGRFQVVETARAYRRRGICSRLVVEAAQRSAAQHGAERFVIVADASYHAVGLYESLGFQREEQVTGVCLWPRSKTL